MRKVVIAGMIGNGLEWYDYALYGQMALTLSRLFFPEGDATVKLLLTYGVFAVGFIARPLGALLFGYIGDKYGRRTSLVISILMMAIPTGCIGLLPTYKQVGLLAPALLTLMRVLQGLSLAGVFSGSMAFVVEHAPAHKRGIIGVTSIISLILGFLLGSFVATVFAYLFSPADFESWGWRIPFILGIFVGMTGLYIRSHCEESPVYEEAKRGGHLSERPVRDAFVQYPKEMFQAFGFYITVTMPFYLVSIYLISFVEKELHRTAREALTLNVMVMLIMLCVQPFTAILSDHIGRKRVQTIGSALVFCAAYPAFLLMDQAGMPSVAAGSAILALVVGFYIASIPALLVELFPTSIRYSGMSISYNLCAALFGGTAPMVCTWLVKQTESHLSIAWYVMACAIISFLTLLTYKDRGGALR